MLKDSPNAAQYLLDAIADSTVTAIDDDDSITGQTDCPEGAPWNRTATAPNGYKSACLSAGMI